MPNDPFDKLDEIRSEKEKDLAARREQNERTQAMYKAIETMQSANQEELEKALPRYSGLFEEIIKEFGARTWGFRETKRKRSYLIFFQEEYIEKQQKFALLRYTAGHTYHVPQNIMTKSICGVGLFSSEDRKYYFLAAEIAPADAKTPEGFEVTLPKYTGNCVVGLLSESSDIDPDSSQISYTYSCLPENMMVVRLEKNAIKQALVDIYLKNK